MIVRHVGGRISFLGEARSKSQGGIYKAVWLIYDEQGICTRDNEGSTIVAQGWKSLGPLLKKTLNRHTNSFQPATLPLATSSSHSAKWHWILFTYRISPKEMIVR